MSQIRNIFRSRWPEITLVVVFQAGLMLLWQQVSLNSGVDPSRPPTSPGWVMFILGAGCMLLAVVWQMLYLGFLRTAAISGSEPQEPYTLLRTGRPYFWRILAVQILLGLAMLVMAGVLTVLIGGIFGYQRAEMFPPWLLVLTLVATVALLVKPMFLIPSFMLVLDYSAIEALKMIWQVRLDQMGHVPKYYGAGLGIIAALAFLMSLAPQDGPLYYIASTAGHMAQSLVFLTMMLATVLYVADNTKTNKTDSMTG